MPVQNAINLFNTWCRLTIPSAGISIPSSAGNYIIPFDANWTGTLGFYLDNTSTKLIFELPGNYLVVAAAQYATTTSTTQRILRVRLNSSGISTAANTNTGITYYNPVAVARANQGDYIELSTVQTTGSALLLTQLNNSAPILVVQRVGV